MLFTSLNFFLFFLVVVIVYFLSPQKIRWGVLLVASYFFYGCWHPGYLALIAICTAVNFVAARQIHRATTQTARRRWLVSGVALSLSILLVFKYFDFFNLAIRQGLRMVDVFYGVPSLQLLLPVGISFFTFQSLSYTIDVYRKAREPETHPGIFALYVSFFPQLVAGPIERSTRLLPQFYERHRFSWTMCKQGLSLILFGLFKKLVVADRLAVYVNEVYNHPGGYEGAPIIAATYFFAVQIYCDFSGYSDIAVGTARVMGYRLMENFDRPYFAASFTDFWRRWHISLSTWFRDYLYFPLGGNRKGRLLQYRNLLIVFLVSALWHGANWTFLVWGGIHVTFLIMEIAAGRQRQRLDEAFKRWRLHYLWTFSKTLLVFHLVTFAWLFFRATTLHDAFLILKNMTSGPLRFDDLFIAVTGSYEFIVALIAIGFLEILSLLTRADGFAVGLGRWPLPVRFGVLYLIMLGIVLLGQFNLTEFIYFQF